MVRAKRKKTRVPPTPTKDAKHAAKSKDSGGSEVERHWKEYWVSRKRLEEAVEKVRAASEVLKHTQEQEKARRSEFEEIRRSLTRLLDVDPVAVPTREPITLPRTLAQTAPKEAG